MARLTQVACTINISTIVNANRKWCLYYKRVIALARDVNYAPAVMIQIVALLTDDSRGVTYSRNMFILQAMVIVLWLLWQHYDNK
jgi:hypothetical protein